MKKNISVTLVSILFLFSFISSCSYNKKVYVAEESDVLDSVYKANHKTLDSFFNKLDRLPDSSDLNAKLVEMDSVEDISKADVTGILNSKKILIDTVLLNDSNFVFVNNKTNLNMWRRDDSLINHAKINYFTSSLMRSQNSTKLDLFDFIDDYYYIYISPAYFKDHGGSVDAEEKEKLIQKTVAEINALNQVDYIVLISDLVMAKPQMITGNTYSAGALISKIKLYNIRSGKLLCQDVIFTKSSPEITALFGKISDKKIKDLELLQDLSKQRNSKIIDYFKLNK